VTRKDLEFFQRNGEGDGEVPGASPWEVMMDREIPMVLKYTSWRRTLPVSKVPLACAACCLLALVDYTLILAGCYWQRLVKFAPSVLIIACVHRLHVFVS